jgi:hypothetical protein
MVRFGAFPGQIPAAKDLPVGKSVGFDVTISVVTPIPTRSVPVVAAPAIPRSGETAELSVPSIVPDISEESVVTFESVITEESVVSV